MKGTIRGFEHAANAEESEQIARDLSEHKMKQDPSPKYFPKRPKVQDFYVKERIGMASAKIWSAPEMNYFG